MSTFDAILPTLTGLFQEEPAEFAHIRPLLVNRDLNARVRLIVDQKWGADERASIALDKTAGRIHQLLGSHAYPAEQALLFEADIESLLVRESTFALDGTEGIYVVDRLATEGNWSAISPPSATTPRIVFFSIKGGVGRSTALAATAWSLAESGRRVLVLDLDLESPGLSSALLPEDRRPRFGIVDWLVEDLSDNSDAVFDSMAATSSLSRNGEIFVVPAHGANAGEYIAKLGRVWMPKPKGNGMPELWSGRLCRMLDRLERRWAPDVTLIDSRAGIDEVASVSLTGLSASTILLFAIDGDQTWSGYQILFRHWRTSGVVRDIRERLQLVGAMIPDTGSAEYFSGLRERAWDVFSDELYDEVPPGEIATEGGFWSFDETDESAPHFPWPVSWHRSFAALKSLHSRLAEPDDSAIRLTFGTLTDNLINTIAVERDQP